MNCCITRLVRSKMHSLLISVYRCIRVVNIFLSLRRYRRVPRVSMLCTVIYITGLSDKKTVTIMNSERL